MNIRRLIPAPFQLPLQRFVGIFRRIADARVRTDYLQSHPVRKLHLGCGDNFMPGWINTDLVFRKKVVYLEMTRRFPFDDAQFDYVYSEHSFEHVPYTGGQRALKECFRVLKAGGKLRLVTPDLRFIVDLYGRDKSDLQRKYIKWAIDAYVPDARGNYSDTFVINNLFSNFGHSFIYDERLLSQCFTQAGFVDVRRERILESRDPVFRNLEHVDRLPEGFLELESLIIEGTKPS